MSSYVPADLRCTVSNRATDEYYSRIMLRTSRIRRLKSISMGICALVFAGFGLSFRWRVAYCSKTAMVRVDSGVITIAQFPAGSVAYPPLGLTLDESAGTSLSEFLWPTARPGWVPGCIELPGWPVLVMVLVPTLLLLRLDRRPPRDHCVNCNYNLTANTSGRCPECGAKTTTAGSSTITVEQE
jgi:hypothetical protein